ncbi:MAG TPA: LuxR C-terminal-related transcriptional regulator [Vicinamibacterales bacterium]|nr:LuxR C-terminal-related transcriptional regulator [Vicinamibacterales bacterium]
MGKAMPGATLATKLVPPFKSSGLVERHALMERVSQAVENRLILVAAPAGYGKTSILAQAHSGLAQQGRHVGWISLDESDKDLWHFISYVIEAVRRSGLRFGQAMSTLLSSGASLPAETLETLLINELAAVDEHFYLFLDDYHLVSDLQIRGLVNTVLLSPMHNVHLVIAARTLNELPVSRLRALGQIHEIEMSDLMFSEAEVAEFVEKVRGGPLSPAQLSRLKEGTEGWAASLQMAGIALRGVRDVDRFLDGFSGEHKSISDFLGDEVLRRQPTEVQEFLIATSILKRFNADLCDAVTQRRDGRRLLDEIETRNLFVFALDPEHRWYRYHHLFSDFLRRRLAERRPDLVAELHVRACKWLADNRFVSEAIEHAFHANDVSRAGELLDGAASDLFAAGQTATLMSLSSRLPPHVLDRLPRLQLECAWYSVLEWKFDDASRSLEHVQTVLDERSRLLSPGDDSDHSKFLRAKLGHRRMMLAGMSDDIPLTSRLAREWNGADQTRDPFMCASAKTLLIAADREQYSCEGLSTSTRMLQERFAACGALYGIVFHQCIAGASFFMRGDLQAAHEAFECSLEYAVEMHGEQSDLYTMPALMLADLHYERNQLRKAEELLAQRNVASQLGFVDNLIAGFLTRARLSRLRGRTEEAETFLEDGCWVAERYRFNRLYAHILNERIRHLLSLGRLKDAQKMLSEPKSPQLLPSDLIPEPAQGVTTGQELVMLAASRVRLEEGRVRETVSLLKAWHAFAKGRHCYRSAIRIGLLLARSYLRMSDRRAAQRVLMDCVQTGEAGGFIRSFVDEGPEIIEVLTELSRSPSTDGAYSSTYLASIIAAAQHPDEQDRGMAKPSTPMTDNHEGLSQREIQILDLGARGMQNLDIAESLCLADSTVKWYWQRIFQKLNVRRRPDAIKRARQQQWIH